MINAELLNSEATLNSFFVIESISYVPGENLDIVVRLTHSERNIRFIPPDAGATITLNLTDKTNPVIPIALIATVVDVGDRSMWKASLTQAQTILLSGSNIEIIYDVAGDTVTIYKTVLRNVLSKNILSSC